MSLIFSIVLITIAWLLSALVDGLPDIWHIFGIVPSWLFWIVLAGIIAWFVSDR